MCYSDYSACMAESVYSSLELPCLSGSSKHMDEHSTTFCSVVKSNRQWSQV